MKFQESQSEAMLLRNVADSDLEAGVDKALEAGVDKALEAGVDKALEVGVDTALEAGVDTAVLAAGVDLVDTATDSVMDSLTLAMDMVTKYTSSKSTNKHIYFLSVFVVV
jgi:hypothetical protein